MPGEECVFNVGWWVCIRVKEILVEVEAQCFQQWQFMIFVELRTPSPQTLMDSVLRLTLTAQWNATNPVLKPQILLKRLDGCFHWREIQHRLLLYNHTCVCVCVIYPQRNVKPMIVIILLVFVDTCSSWKPPIDMKRPCSSGVQCRYNDWLCVFGGKKYS